MRFLILFVILSSGCFSHLQASNPLMPVKTDTPRDTMTSYMEAMADYQRGLQTGSAPLLGRIHDATRCFNLDHVNILSRDAVGQEAAILLKEVIDRVIVIDYSKVPDQTDEPRWRLKDSEIVISRVQEGDRAGEYLFSPDTTDRVREFYKKVSHLPYLEGTGQGAGYREPFIDQLPPWATKERFGLAVWQWIGLLISIFLGLALRTFVKMLGNLIKKFAHKTPSDWDNRIINQLAGPVALLAASGLWFGSLYILKFQGIALSILGVSVKVFFFLSLIWFFYRTAGLATEYFQQASRKTQNKLDDELIKLMGKSLKVFVVIFGVLIAAQNMGIEVFSLLAGLGIGGLAIALAAKDTLANFFGSLMIILDRPFRVGHWVIIGNAEGTVEEIGFRSTRIRTFYNSVITIPNSEIATKGVDNMGMRVYRRVTTTLGVTYDTPSQKIEAFLEGIKNIIRANEYTRKDYFHVAFNDFGPSSLNILLYFFLTVPDWSQELIQRQNIFLEIIRLAKSMEIDFAFPTQTLHVETFPGKGSLLREHEVEKEILLRKAQAFGPQGTQSQPYGSGLFTPPYQDV